MLARFKKAFASLLAVAMLLMPAVAMAGAEVKDVPWQQAGLQGNLMLESMHAGNTGAVISAVWLPDGYDGAASNLAVIRYDLDGNVKWVYKGGAADSNVNNNRTASCTGDGGAIYLFSEEHDDSINTNYICKLDNQGRIEWEKIYKLNVGDGAMLNSIAEVADGYIASVGPIIIKLDKQGEVKFTRNLGFTVRNATGMTDDLLLYDTEGTVCKIDSNGVSAEGAKDLGSSIDLLTPTPDGYVGIANLHAGRDAADRDTLVKLDKQGNVLWRQPLQTLSNGIYEDVLLIDGKYYVKFSHNNFDGGPVEQMHIFDTGGRLLSTEADFIHKALGNPYAYSAKVAGNKIFVLNQNDADNYQETLSVITYSPDSQNGNSQGSNNQGSNDQGGSSTPAQSGWVQSNGKWHYMKEGKQFTGWLQEGAKWYYLKPEMAMGWNKVGSSWYYFKNNGVMHTGWVKDISGSTVRWYYLKPGGAMATGWQQVGSAWYYFEPSGVMATDWKKLGSTWYYLGDNGAMATGTRVIGGKTYRFSASGAWI